MRSSNINVHLYNAVRPASDVARLHSSSKRPLKTFFASVPRRSDPSFSSLSARFLFWRAPLVSCSPPMVWLFCVLVLFKCHFPLSVRSIQPIELYHRSELRSTSGKEEFMMNLSVAIPLPATLNHWSRHCQISHLPPFSYHLPTLPDGFW